MGSPKISSQEVTYEDFEKQVFFKDTSKTLIELWSGGPDPEASFKFDHAAKQYMHINLKQITKTYDKDGVETVTATKVPVELCKDSFFVNEYEKKFYKTFQNSNLLCADTDEIFLRGTRDSKVMG